MKQYRILSYLLMYMLLGAIYIQSHPLEHQQHRTYIKKALIFGITGQDGSYLAELLIEKGYIAYTGGNSPIGSC